MDINEMISELKQAQQDFDEINRTQKPIEIRLVEDEIPLVLKFAEKIIPFSKKISVHGTDAVLLYVFNSNGKTLISPEVYLKTNGDVVYEVYDENGYRSFRPTAMIQDGYNVISLKEFLHTVPFHEIVSFYKDRIDVLYEDAESIVEDNKFRKAFNDKMKQFLK